MSPWISGRLLAIFAAGLSGCHDGPSSPDLPADLPRCGLPSGPSLYVAACAQDFLFNGRHDYFEFTGTVTAVGSDPAATSTACAVDNFYENRSIPTPRGAPNLQWVRFGDEGEQWLIEYSTPNPSISPFSIGDEITLGHSDGPLITQEFVLTRGEDVIAYFGSAVDFEMFQHVPLFDVSMADPFCWTDPCGGERAQLGLHVSTPDGTEVLAPPGETTTFAGYEFTVVKNWSTFKPATSSNCSGEFPHPDVEFFFLKNDDT